MLPKKFLLIPLIVIILFPLSVKGFNVTTQSQVDLRDVKNVLSGVLWSYHENIVPQPKILSPLEIVKKHPLVQKSEINSGQTFTRNMRVSKDFGYFYENEPSIGYNINNPDNLVIGAHQYTDIGIYTAAYVSFDGGESWKGPILLPLSKPEDYGASDPSITSDRSGIFYYSYMSIGYRNITVSYGYYNYSMIIFSNDIVVSRSLDGGINWESYIAVTPERMNLTAPPGVSINSIYLDKPYVRSGPYKGDLGKDIVLVSYTEILAGFDYNKYRSFANITIKVTISTDGGVTWSEPISITPPIDFYENRRVVQGSIPAISPDGTIYVAYYDSGNDGWLNGTGYIMVARSLDGGKSFEEPVIAAVIPNEMSYYSGFIGFRWWSSMFPSMDIGPDGTIYIVFAADPDGPSGDPGDIFFVKSTDGGLTWSKPKRINDDNTINGQFFPWLDVDYNGTIHVIWGDRRLDPDDFGYDIYYANSMDGGNSFSANIRVTDYTNNPLFGMTFFIGDYFNVVATGRNVHVVWTDSRRGLRKIGGFYWLGVDESIYTAKLGPRAEPSLKIFPSDVQAGQIVIINIAGENFPIESAFTVYIDGVQLAELVAIFTDKEGRFNVNVTVPASSEGIHKIALGDYTLGRIYASASLNIVDYTFKKMSERLDLVNSSISQLHNKFMEAVGRFEKRFTALESGISDVISKTESSYSKLLREMENRFDKTQASISDLSERVKEVDDKVSDLGSRLDSFKSAIDDRLSTLKNSLQSQISKLQEGVEANISRSNISIIISIVLGIIIIALLILIFKRK